MDYEKTDKIYCYPASDILRNKFNIRDDNELSYKERLCTSYRILNLKNDIVKIKGNLDLKHLQDIHKYIFQDVYDWAGELRKIDIAKGVMFAYSQFIIPESNRIFAELKNEQYLSTYSTNKFCERLAYYKAEINMLHPFREGNGRSIREFTRELAKFNDYNLDYSLVSEDEYMDAMVQSSTNNNKLIQVMKKCVSPINVKKIIVRLYKNEFPAIKLISDDAAASMYNININRNEPYSIKDINNKYKEIGNCLDSSNKQYSKNDFNNFKNIVDDLSKAKLNYSHNKVKSPDKVKSHEIEI